MNRRKFFQALVATSVAGLVVNKVSAKQSSIVTRIKSCPIKDTLTYEDLMQVTWDYTTPMFANSMGIYKGNVIKRDSFRVIGHYAEEMIPIDNKHGYVKVNVSKGILGGRLDEFRGRLMLICHSRLPLKVEVLSKTGEVLETLETVRGSDGEYIWGRA